MPGWRCSPQLCGGLLALLSLACAPARSAEPDPDLVGGMQIPGASAALLAWGSDGSILRSGNGHDWRHAITTSSTALTQIASDAEGAVLVAVGASGTILRSVDAGNSWQAARNKTVDTDLNAVTSAGGKAWIAVGTAGRILRSTDDGKSWSRIDSRLDLALRVLSFDAASGRVFLGGDAGVVGFSKDRGESWQVTSISMPQPATSIGAFHRFGKLLLTTSSMGRFLVSDDDGIAWDLLQSSSQAFFMDAVHDPDHDTIVMTGDNGDVLRSADSGRTWEGNEVLLDGRKSRLGAIRHDPRGHALLLISEPGGVVRSTDGGLTWTSATSELRGEIRGLIHDTARGAFVVFGADGLLAVSGDSTAHWTIASIAPRAPPREGRRRRAGQ